MAAPSTRTKELLRTPGHKKHTTFLVAKKDNCICRVSEKCGKVEQDLGFRHANPEAQTSRGSVGHLVRGLTKKEREISFCAILRRPKWL